MQANWFNNHNYSTATSSIAKRFVFGLINLPIRRESRLKTSQILC